VRDPFFKIEDYLVKRLAKNFGKAEDYGFIRGTGVDMPTGILADEGGAEIGATTKALTYDDVVKLFFSVKPEYRKNANAVWRMVAQLAEIYLQVGARIDEDIRRKKGEIV
jgi:HK97 family phage major capsid protein